MCFDVDSTLCTDECIDEFAAFLGVGDEVARLTASAMGGSTRFEDALRMRLGVMQPTRESLERFVREHPPQVTPGARELVAALQRKGIEVFLVSGGFRATIAPLADILSVPRDHIYANVILFDEETGKYAGFDAAELTSRSGGKRDAVRAIRAREQGPEGRPGPVIMIGDGATDAEAVAEDGAAAFIGFGGVAEREAVKRKADWFVYDLADIQSVLEA